MLHASDLQCGRPFRPDAAEAFIRLAEELSPDVIVVAGDLTQRAKKREYALARSILDRLPDVPSPDDIMRLGCSPDDIVVLAEES